VDKIQSMQVFVRVAEMNSFTRAAESLSLPKASVSRLIQQLESQLGVRLLHRSTRRVQLTQDGQVYYDRCKELLASVEEMETLFQANPATISGRLRVDMSVAMARDFVLPKLGEFLNRYPAIEIELSSTDHRVDVIREGFDCVIRVGTLKDSGLIARPAWISGSAMDSASIATTGAVCSSCMVVCSDTVSTVFSGVCMLASINARSSRARIGVPVG